MMFRFLRALLIGIFVPLYRLRIEGRGRIPPEGPVLLAANHASYWDAVFLQIGCRRQIRWMMDGAYYRLPLLNWLFRAIGCIPLAEGGGNRAALRAATEALQAGGVVGIFPEGFLSRTGRMRRAQTGVALLAARAGAPVVPAYLRGAFFGWHKGQIFPRLSRVTVRFGDPMWLRRREALSKGALQGFADRVMGAIKGLYGHGQARRTEAPAGTWDGSELRGELRGKDVGEPLRDC